MPLSPASPRQLLRNAQKAAPFCYFCFPSHLAPIHSFLILFRLEGGHRVVVCASPIYIAGLSHPFLVARFSRVWVSLISFPSFDKPFLSQHKPFAPQPVIGLRFLFHTRLFPHLSLPWPKYLAPHLVMSKELLLISSCKAPLSTRSLQAIA